MLFFHVIAYVQDNITCWCELTINVIRVIRLFPLDRTFDDGIHPSTSYFLTLLDRHTAQPGTVWLFSTPILLDNNDPFKIIPNMSAIHFLGCYLLLRLHLLGTKTRARSCMECGSCAVFAGATNVFDPTDAIVTFLASHLSKEKKNR